MMKKLFLGIKKRTLPQNLHTHTPTHLHTYTLTHLSRIAGSRQAGHTKKAAALIMVIFAMLLFGMLGWTLANLQTGDFEMNLRNLDAERALSLADAGGDWALQQLAMNFDCTAISGATYPHTLSPGQYTCGCSLSGSTVTLTVTGYVPTQASPRATRQIEINATQGGFSNAIAGSNEFNWHNALSGSVSIKGNVVSPNFEGSDANTLTNNLLIDDTTIPGPATVTVGPTAIPAIDMQHFEDYATSLGPTGCGGSSCVINGPYIFSTDPDHDKLYYVKGDVTIATGTAGNGINFNKTSLVAEGNITVTGNRKLTISTHVNNSSHESFPNLATKNGNITSATAPSSAKALDRNFDGLIYTQLGTVDFNYIYLRGGIMGVTVKVRGKVDILYNGKYVSDTGFGGLGNISSVTWKEK